MFKKICTGGVVIGTLFFNVAFAQTNTSTEQDLLIIIKQLQAQIQSMQAQIVDLKAEVQSVKLELKFSRALAQGATGDDVKQLQEFLKAFTGSYPDGSITGYFGPRTEAAVKKFQEQNGIASVGVVGPKTQEKLNVLAAAIPAATPCINCSPTTTALVPIPAAQTTPVIASPGTGISAIPAARTMPTTSATLCRTPVEVQIQPDVVTVLSPNGGEQWQVGGTYTIKYSAKDIVGNKALLIYLEKGYDAPTTKTGANSSQLIGVTTNLESYTYMVPTNVQAWPGLGSNYKITIMVEGSYSSCGAVSYIGDSSDAEFSIVAGQYNVPGTSGGGYGVSTAPVLTPTPTLSPTIVTTQAKIATIQAQISALQEKLNTTTDAAIQASLKAQIAALQTVVQELQNQIYQGKLLPVASATPIPQNQLQILYAQHSAITKQFNSTTDPATRNALWAQQTAVSEQIQALTPPEPTTQKQINSLLEEISAYQGKLSKLDRITYAVEWDNLTARISALKARIQILESNPTAPAVQLLFTQIIALQNQLNGTIDATTRNSLVSQIVALKARMAFESGAITPPAAQPALSTPSVSVQIAPANQDKINSLFEQINALQNQLNSTIDTATRGSLTTQIIELKAQVNALQTNSSAVSVTQGVTTSGGYVQPTQDKPITTRVPETAIAGPSSQTNTATQSPAIKVLSPNGGESFTAGQTYVIKWTGGNSAVDLYLLDNPTRLGKKIFSGIINNNYIRWVASPLSSSDLSNYATPSGQYIILVNCADGNCAVDFSDSYFKIVSQ